MTTDILASTALSMTSREIAKLVESRHDKVKQSIERLVNREVIVQPPLGDIPYVDDSGRNRTTSAYIFSGEQGKRDSIVVVAQLSPEFTARLVDRWQELEHGQATPALPDFSDPAAAARAWADQYEAKLKLEGHNRALLQRIETDAPYVELAKALTGSDECLTRRAWIAMMKSDHGLPVKEKRVNAWLAEKGYIYYDQLTKEAMAYARYDKWFKLVPERINGGTRNLLKVTGRGVLELTPIVLKHFSMEVA